MSNKIDNRQVVQRSAQAMIGSGANDTLDTIFPKVNDELAKLFEDRNLLLAGGGDIAVNGAATSVTFSSALTLHINSQVAGGAPTIIDLAATTRAFSADGRMLYAVINRIAGTATVTADSTTLPAVTSANQEVVLIAKRVGTDIIFRDGTKIPASRTVKLGSNDIFGSMGATDNKLVRTDGTDGKTVQGTGITVDDSNNLSTPGTVYSGASTIHASAAMQFDSTLKGALVPRMTTTEQNAIASPATGLLIFNTTTNAFHYYNGATWQAVGTSAGITTQAVLSTGSWVVPAGVSKLMCLVAGSGGGGGGGGNGPGGTHGGGGGGGGGGTIVFLPVSVTPGETLTASLAAGGSAGPTNNNGGSGNTSTLTGTFGTLRARGGNGGSGTPNNVGGSGASNSATVTGTTSAGGTGGNGGTVGVSGGTTGATGESSARAFGGAGGTPLGGASGGGGGGGISNGGQGGNGAAEGTGAGLTAGAAGSNGSGGGGGGGGAVGVVAGSAGGTGGPGFISVWY